VAFSAGSDGGGRTPDLPALLEIIATELRDRPKFSDADLEGGGAALAHQSEKVFAQKSDAATAAE
jgi:hypothetical protein